MAIDEFGGSHGPRNLGLLESAVARPRATFSAKDLNPTIFLKDAALVHSLLMNRQFVDGNKRTALFAVMTLLEVNGYEVIAKQKGSVDTALWIENKKPELENIAAWIKKHTKKK